MTKNKRDRLAQAAKRRQDEEVAKQLQIEVAESMKPMARTGVPGHPAQPLTPGAAKYPGAGPGKGQVHSR